MKNNLYHKILLVVIAFLAITARSGAQQSNTAVNTQSNSGVDFQHSLAVRNDLERAMWIWNTENVVYSVGTAKSDFFDFCANHKGVGDAAAPALTQHPIDRLFFYAQGFIVSGDEEKDSLRSFLREAHIRGIHVDYLDGEPGWLAGDAGTATKIIDAFVKFNNGGTPEERFDGVLLDIEPYRVNGWYSDVIWQQYLNLLKNIRKTLRSQCTSVRFGSTMPRWYDITLGHEKIKQLYRTVDYVTVLDYVNDDQRLINDVADEIMIADTMSIRAYIGVETGADILSTVSFHNKGWLAMEQSLNNLNSTYIFNKSYAGVAIHRYATYTEMRRTPRSLEYADICVEADFLDTTKLARSNADIMIIDKPDADFKNMAREIRYIKTKGTGEQKRYIVAELPMIKALKIYNVLAAMESFKQSYAQNNGKGLLNEFESAWTDSLTNEVSTQISNAMNAGFDGIETDLNEAFSIAKAHDIPKPENKIVDIMVEIRSLMQKNFHQLNSIILVESDPDFINKLDEKHYTTFMELVDGVIFGRHIANTTAYTAYGVKVFDPTNFSHVAEDVSSSNDAASGK